jgi:lipopolysaccharide/colanic/teichoic acid biosynthesis glycosyltransferase
VVYVISYPLGFHPVSQGLSVDHLIEIGLQVPPLSSTGDTVMTTIPSALRLLMGRATPDVPACDEDTGLEPIVLGQAARSAAKRSMDMVGAGFALLLLSPVLVFVAMLVRFDSKGPILFRQTRVGLRGRTFTCLKFRTMVPDAEERLAALEDRNESACKVLFKIKDDPRVTTLGRLLRRSSLDELPQLWNILRGEMSLIGPRPLQLRDSERLAALEPEGFARRLSVLPGLSGPWQVAGRSNLHGGQMLDLDLDYVENWSIATDLDLIARTVSVVLSGRGAS